MRGERQYDGGQRPQRGKSRRPARKPGKYGGVDAWMGKASPSESRKAADQRSNLTGAPAKPDWATGTGTENMAPGTSIFDPVLTELSVRWFSAPGAAVLDPFAGGSVRGVVAALLGRHYTGIDLRSEQIEANQRQWDAIAGRDSGQVTKLTAIPPLTVVEHDGIRVVRDDMLTGGTKVRALVRLIPLLDATELIYASPAYGYAQIALAQACAIMGKKATVFVAKRKDLHPRTAKAKELGADIQQVPHGYLTHVTAKAKEWAHAEAGRLLLPFGLKDERFIDALADVARESGESPTEVWCVAGSGVLARALRRAWPSAKLCVVKIGSEPDLDGLDATVYEAPEDYEKPAKQPPEFPSCDNYDAKAWRFIKQHATPGALFWNVAGNDSNEARQIKSDTPPQWIVGDSQHLDELLPTGVQYDLVFSCPPYADLEQYSNDPADISNMKYPAFLKAYRKIIQLACDRLKPDRFAVWVIGEVRDKNGIYYGLVPDTIRAFQDAGLGYYNEAVLVTAVGSLPIRAGKQFMETRKIGKTHQNVIVFVKGNPARAAKWCGDTEFGEPAEEIGEEDLQKD